MTMFSVDDNCRKCGLCAELCLARIIRFEKGEQPFVPPEAEKDCLTCGQCVSFCPKRACYLDFQPKEDRRPIKSKLLPETEVAETFLRSRRSVRRFKKEAVEESMVRRILETTRYAPSASNRQPVRWIVTRDRAKTLELAAMVAEHFQAAIKARPDDENMIRVAAALAPWQEGRDVIFRGAPLLAVALVDRGCPFPEDASLALTYFELAAHANGVGCCWAGFFTMAARQNEAIRKAIGIEEHELVCGAQMFGYPKGLRARLLPPRKKINLSRA